MKIRIAWLVTIFAAIVLITGCSPRARYERKLERETKSGIRHDSLFMGLYFGMTSKDFFIHCWGLNKKGIIRQSDNNTSVEYKIEKELDHPAVMNFYPTFRDDRIIEIPVRFKYRGWAPWNKKLSAGKLQEDVLQWYRKKYGYRFIKVSHPMRGSVYVRIDGNRRITIYKTDELYVWAYFTDLSVSDTKDSDVAPDNVPQDTIQ